MSSDRSEKPIRVLFCHPESARLDSFADAVGQISGFDFEEYAGDIDEIWPKAISSSANVTVLYFHELGDTEERCIRRILRGSFSQILLLTKGAVASEILKSDDRIEIYALSKSTSNFDSIISRIWALAKKNRGKSTAVEIKALDDIHEKGASVLAEGSLAGKLVAVGASTGGTEALAAFFHGLRPKMPGIVVVQHMPPVFTAMYADRLNRELPFDVVEAKDNVQIKPNSIHIAPGDKHLRIKKVGRRFFTLVGGTAKVNGHCPSVDVLFESVAAVAGLSASGVILTGMGSDGANGLLAMREQGSFTLGQDEASSVVYGMPKQAFDIGAVVKQASLNNLAAELMKYLNI